MKNECRCGHYVTNEVVTHGPIVCFGFNDVKVCKHLEKCLSDNGYEIYLRKTKHGPKKSIRRIKNV